MIATKLKEIEAAKIRLAALEQSAAADLATELAQLPERFGFASAKAFIKAVKAAGSRGARQPTRSSGGRRTRTTITDAMRAEVKKLAKDGNTGDFIAAKVGISVPSVQNIKKAFGLVRKKRKTSPR